MWRRSFLSYKEKYEQTFVPETRDEKSRVRIDQCSSLSELKKRFGISTTATTTAEEEEEDDDDEDDDGGSNEDDRDPVPETGFTIWDASLLLAAYLERKEKMEAFLLPARAPAGAPNSGSRGFGVVELGAGTGAGTLLLVESVEKMKGNDDVRFVVTDLGACLHLLRHNVRESRMSSVVSVARLEWGATRREKDLERVKNLLSPSRNIDLVIGADLCYTSNEDVIKNLAATVKMCGSRACVMAFCREHNPKAVDLFETLSEDTFEVKKVTNSDPSWPEHMRDDSDDFVIFEMTRRDAST
jgi:hypothetical protein